ncbi:MAG TPA: sigma-70 family RNA polymerase sigma factor [Phycisphaerae bacterium]|nr:sigma-70 family RNA polymerase sigma factor [Phycisphaerae bacterium]HRY66767.1 sigma-70 family RNA polymerase sigma factor [Phycisphaerae bacterium]HSA28407.1 sigma-70 family RNA polymerase sigma factor [Phycisphaerae bacterium]
MSKAHPGWRLSLRLGHKTMTESQLVERCREGDREAQRELYALTSDRVHRLLVRMTGNPDDALDLTQDTYIRVFGKIHQFDGHSQIATWVYRVAVNEALQFLRRQGHQRLPQFRDSESPADAAQTPVVATDVRLDVGQALSQLPEWERTLVILRHFEGLNYAEMARVLEKPEGTIASGLNRARKMLRDMLGPGPGHEA